QPFAALFGVLFVGLVALVAAAALLVVLPGPLVDAARGPHLAAHLGHLGPQGGQAGILHAEFGGLGGGQLVFVPEFGGQLVVLPFGGAFALRQAGHFPAGVLPVFGGGAGGGLGFGLGGLPLHPAAGGGLDGRLLFPDGVAAAPGLVLHFLDGPEDLPVPGLQVADGCGQAVLMGAGVGQALLPVRDAAAAELGVLLAGQL